MYPTRLFKEAVPLLAAVVFLFALIFTLLARRPVVLVGDRYFTELYGRKREQAKIMELSVLLLRRVRPFLIDDAGANTEIAEAMLRQFKNPYCVVFPYRYASVANVYAQNTPWPVFVLEERNLNRPVTGKACYIPTDWTADFFRAGFFSARLARAGSLAETAGDAGESAPPAESEKTILLLSQENLLDAAKQAFEAGLKAGGWNGQNLVASSASQLSLHTISSAVLVSSASSFIQNSTGNPCVVFSAVSKQYMPHFVKVALDDSPLALLAGTVRQTGAVRRGKAGDIANDRTGKAVPAQARFFLTNGLPPALYLRLLFSPPPKVLAPAPDAR
jgi:hypothetical protein